MIKDGIEPRPFKICPTPCRACGPACRMADVDAGLRDEGWMPIEEAPICRTRFAHGQWTVSDDMCILEGLTTHGNFVLMRYIADGDYADRWGNGAGNIVYAVTHWRLPKPPRQLEAQPA